MTGIFAVDKDTHQLDDQEQPVHSLIFKALLSLPPDVRGICMSRIIVTGGGSHIPGLKSRLLEEVSTLVADRGWDPVEGKAADRRRARLKEIKNPQQNRNHGASASTQDASTPVDVPPKLTAKTTAAAFQEQVHDPIAEKLQREQLKGTKPLMSGKLRVVETLGPWAGEASLHV